MNSTRHHKPATGWLRRALGAAVLLTCSFGMASADTVGFNPSLSNVAPGDTFSVDIVGLGFTELSGGTIDLGFDSAHLQINSVSIDAQFDFLPEGGGPAVGNVWPGIGFDVFDNDPAAGDFTIATISLTALTAGISNLVILNSSEFFSTTALLDPTLTTGTVNVSAVPVPAAVWLLGSGLIGLLGVAKRRR